MNFLLSYVLLLVFILTINESSPFLKRSNIDSWNGVNNSKPMNNNDLGSFNKIDKTITKFSQIVSSDKKRGRLSLQTYKKRGRLSLQTVKKRGRLSLQIDKKRGRLSLQTDKKRGRLSLQTDKKSG